MHPDYSGGGTRGSKRKLLRKSGWSTAGVFKMQFLDSAVVRDIL